MNNIYIYDSNNKRLEMEVVTIFKFANNIFNYVIYTDMDRNNYYVAKYVYEIDELNTDLTENELNICNQILEGVLL
ncbi:MAG: hypothetical protein IK997_01820 [Bacilli bacterium]|nr:hypothetical protein [Bacilli bacterium]